MKMLTHLNDVHGAEAVNGMAGLMAWSHGADAGPRTVRGGPAAEDHRRDVCLRAKRIRALGHHRHAVRIGHRCARPVPPRPEKHGALRGMLSFLAVNTTYRGPATPGSAAALAFGLAVPDENAKLMKKLRGGIGALTAHLATSW